MAKILFQNIAKKYGTFYAVKNFNLEVQDREFICLVGPSGCGKTTTLRMLAGLEEISEGTISIDDQVINEVTPKDRDIAMVFQSYALYPHYTIYDNLAFGLRTRQKIRSAQSLINLIMFLFYAVVVGIYYGVCQLIDLFLPGNSLLFFIAGIFGGAAMLFMFPETRFEIRMFLIKFFSRWKMFNVLQKYLAHEELIRQQIYETSKLLGIESQLRKKPKQLSGGQRQRVALGRAIIRNPKAFLMDEPLSNLDAKLRVQMRAELQRLTKRLKVTTIYVTHDQIEAMTLADRIVVMNEAKAHQVGTPEEVYNNPVNMFVAGFIGSPSMNFIKGTIKLSNGRYIFINNSLTYDIPHPYETSIKDYLEKDIVLGIRPEHIEILKDEENAKLSAVVGVLEPIGSDTYIYLDFPSDLILISKVEGIANFDLDQKVGVRFIENRIHFFDPESQRRILPEGGLAIPYTEE